MLRTENFVCLQNDSAYNLLISLLPTISIVDSLNCPLSDSLQASLHKNRDGQISINQCPMLLCQETN